MYPAGYLPIGFRSAESLKYGPDRRLRALAAAVSRMPMTEIDAPRLLNEPNWTAPSPCFIQQKEKEKNMATLQSHQIDFNVWTTSNE